MKKLLIASAILCLSGAVMAQSSVTMYGVADAALIKLQRQKMQMGSGSGDLMTNGDSRLGVRGNEDLGGGLNVGFNFETRLSLETGGALGKNPAGGFWSPTSKVWIGGNWGTFSMGRTLTPSFYGVFAWELTGAANYTLVGNTYGWGGANPRNDSQFGYKTPNLGGFTAEIGYITKSDYQTFMATPAKPYKDKWDMNLLYANGPITASLTANKVLNAANQNKVNWSLGGRYNFGNFIVAASYNDAYQVGAVSKWVDATTITPITLGRRAGVTLGGTALFGPFSMTVDVSHDTKRQILLGTNNKKLTNSMLEGKYAFSKRTFVYAAYLHRDRTNNYGLGLRHNF